MTAITRPSAFIVASLCALSFRVLAGDTSSAPKQVACVGDSITFGARLENRDTDSYPAKLQALLGQGYNVHNFGVGSCTLIRKGKPNVWSLLEKIKKANPDIIIISLGTNDTCGGKRKCWAHKDDFPNDYRDLLDILLALPSKPHIWVCAPTPMVLETPGLDPSRIADLKERKPRLQELIKKSKEVAEEKKVSFIDLNTPMANKPELFTEKDGVHPNKAGYETLANLVYAALTKPAPGDKNKVNSGIGRDGGLAVRRSIRPPSLYAL